MKAGRTAALAVVVVALGCRGPVRQGPVAVAAGDDHGPDDAATPYSLPVVLPEEVRSPPIDPAAPYTPVVMSLLGQLLPARPTAAQIDAAVAVLTGGGDGRCRGPGTNGAPGGTTPTLMPLCWVDGQGISDLQAPGTTTAPMQMVGLAATFDRQYANAWGQVEGREGRQLMMTGLLGPQVDVSAFANWGRGVNASSGEDPFLGGELAAAQIHGMQGAGLMSQVKHLGPYFGVDERRNVVVPDQALHELFLPPFEQAVKEGGAAALMASYQLFEVDAARLPERVSALAPGSPFARAADGPVVTWPLAGPRFSSEHPWLLGYVLRGLWGSRAAFVGPDYGGIHSASSNPPGPGHGARRRVPGHARPGRNGPHRRRLRRPARNAGGLRRPGGRPRGRHPGPGLRAARLRPGERLEARPGAPVDPAPVAGAHALPAGALRAPRL